MSSTFSDNLKIELIGTGEQSGVWGSTTNTNLGTLIEQAISGVVTQTITDGSGATTTITIPDGASGVARNMYIEMTGALTFANTSLIVPTNKKLYFIYNATTGGHPVTVKVSGQTGVSVPNGKKVILVMNSAGTDIVDATNYMSALTLGAALPLASGGTGQTTATAAFNALAPAQGSNSGKFLTTDGTNASWAPVATPPGGSTTQVQYNSSGAFAGSANMTFSGTVLTLANDASISGLTVGKGGAAISTSTAIGSGALQANTQATALENTAVGYHALYSINSFGGGYNTAVGSSAMATPAGGSYNAVLGYEALFSGSGSFNTALGAQAMSSGGTGSGNIVIGGRTAAGSLSPVFNVTSTDNRVVMGSTAVTNAYVQVAWTVVSDARDKTDFAAVPHGLDFVSKLNPVAYRFKLTRESTEGHGPLRYGFKAQDILALEGESSVIIDADDPEKLRYQGESLVPVLVKAIQELKAELETVKAQVAALSA